MIGTLDSVLKKGNKSGTTVMDFSKAFDTLKRNLMAYPKAIFQKRH